MNRDKMRARIRAITAGFRNSLASVPADDKATKLARTVKGKFGGVNTPAEMEVVQMLTENSGVNVRAAYDRLPDPSAPVANPVLKWLHPLVALSHESFRGTPCVCVDTYYRSPSRAAQGVLANGSMSGDLNFTGMRLATDEEVERLTDAQLDYFIRLYTGA